MTILSFYNDYKRFKNYVLHMLSIGFGDPTAITGYDSTKTQTLKNVNGTLTWVTEA